MQSATKNKQPPEVISRLVEANLPGVMVAAVDELSGGFFNAAYHVKGSGLPPNGAVLKAGPVPGTPLLTYEKDILAAEIEAYHLLADTPLPLPRLLAEDTSRLYADFDYFIMEFVPGTPWHEADIPDGEKPALLQKIGEYNAETHKKRGEWFGYIKQDARYHFKSWDAAFAGMMADILEDGRRRQQCLPYERINSMVQKYASLLAAVKRPSLVNFDMWAGNILVEQRQGKWDITGLIDFERGFFGDPYADFISAVLLYEDVEQEPDFIIGYERASGKSFMVTGEDRVRMNLYRLYLNIIMHVESYRYDDKYARGLEQRQLAQINALLEKL